MQHKTDVFQLQIAPHEPQHSSGELLEAGLDLLVHPAGISGGVRQVPELKIVHTYKILTFLLCRVYLSYHSWKQVLVGTAVGMAFALFWFALTHLVLSPLFPTIVTW
jgi:hypothetical protein